MNITRAALEKKQVTIIALLVILVAGIRTFVNMPRAEDPGFIIRTAQVSTYFPGASPERVEQLVTDKLEKVIQEIPEIDFISSESKTGVSVIFVNIKERYKEMRPIWDDLRRKVDRAKSDLPGDVFGPFVNDEFGDVFGIVIALTGEGYTYAELKEIADDVRSELLLLENAAKVEIRGIQQERIHVEYNNARLAELGISPLQLQEILESRNIIIPGGEIYTQDEQIILEPTGNFDSIDDLRQTIIKLPGREQVIYLRDVVKIYRGYLDPPASKVHYRGKPALSIAINLREGGNIIELGEQVKTQVERFRSKYPIGVEFNIVAFQPIHVAKKTDDFTGSLLQAVGIVLAVMILFLGFRTGLIVASLIPMAMVMAVFIMSFFHIGLDQMSLASLIIALGMLVDNAIVMSESIMVQMGEGKKAVAAAIDSASELRIPLLVSSLTTAAAFLPIYLAESSTGEYTAPLFKVVTITLLSSWLLALTMTPLFCVSLLKVKKDREKEGFNSRFYRTYRRFLIGALRRPLLSAAVTASVFALALFGFRFVPQIFFPENDKAIFFAELRLPIGTPLSKTDSVVNEIEGFMEKELLADLKNGKEGIIDWVSYVGEGAPRYVLGYNPEPPSTEYAYLIINGTSRDHIVEEIIPKLDSYTFGRFPDLTTNIRLLFLGPPVDNPVEVRISGRDNDVLFGIVESVKANLATVPGTINITDDWGQRTKKLLVKVNQPRALRAGLTSRDIAVSLQTVLTGIDTTDYREGDEVIPITLRSVAADRKDIGKLESHNIYVQSTGKSVPLKQVADAEMVWQPSKILRRDRLRTVTAQSNITPGVNAIAISSKIDEWLKGVSENWDIGYKYELGGEFESSGEANASIVVKLPIAGLIILLLLVGQFNSIRKTIIVALTIPLGLIGVSFGLLVTRSYFGFMTLLGIISLAGIVINNAIVLLDRIRIEIEENGMEPAAAIVESAQRRLRPILLTAATTVGGLMPLWFGGGPMWEPMAISIIFGLIFATVLTLGVVPVLYSLFFRVEFKDFTYREES
jgi:multidrug efflux pump subunit AcrB